MRLIHRHRPTNRRKAPRIAISQAEITADLQYPAAPHAVRAEGNAGRRGAGR